MAIAGFLVVELGMCEGELGSVGNRPQRHGHERLPFRHGEPLPRKNEPAVRFHFAIGTAALVLLAIQGSEYDAKPTTWVHVGLGAQDGSCIWTPPEQHLLGLGPGGINVGRRRLEAANKGKAWGVSSHVRSGGVVEGAQGGFGLAVENEK